MRRSMLVSALALLLSCATPAAAQQEVPNPMAGHTLFVILITGAFLVWAASYSLHFRRDTAEGRKHEREALAERREELFDEIAALESEHESGAISDTRYKNRMRALRGELTRTVLKLEAATRGSERRPSARTKKRA